MLENKWLNARLLFSDRRGRWRVQGAGKRAPSILHLGLGAISLSLSLQPSQKVLESRAPSVPPAKHQCLCYRQVSEVEDTIPSSVHPKVLVSIPQHSQETSLKTKAWSEGRVARSNTRRSVILVTFPLTIMWLEGYCCLYSKHRSQPSALLSCYSKCSLQSPRSLLHIQDLRVCPRPVGSASAV